MLLLVEQLLGSPLIGLNIVYSRTVLLSIVMPVMDLRLVLSVLQMSLGILSGMGVLLLITILEVGGLRKGIIRTLKIVLLGRMKQIIPAIEVISLMSKLLQEISGQ